jgi:hypothetical protein
MALETDPDELDYRIYDGYAQGLMYTLIRAGARMVAEGGEAAATFQSILVGIERLSKEAKRGFVRSDALEFLESATHGFKIKAGMTWTIGAPISDVRVKHAKAAAPAQPAQVPGLGADIGELWRRFPLDVKQEGAMYVVRFHNKKLRERYEKEGGKYRTVGDLEAVLARHIIQLVDTSAFWKRGPAMPGTLVTIVKKNEKQLGGNTSNNTMDVYTSYKKILTAWSKNASMSDIYHMIIDWINTYKPEEVAPSIAPLIKDFMQRALDGDETNDLVEDFIYGDQYVGIRETFSR